MSFVSIICCAYVRLWSYSLRITMITKPMFHSQRSKSHLVRCVKQTNGKITESLCLAISNQCDTDGQYYCRWNHGIHFQNIFLVDKLSDFCICVTNFYIQIKSGNNSYLSYSPQFEVLFLSTKEISHWTHWHTINSFEIGRLKNCIFIRFHRQLATYWPKISVFCLLESFKLNNVINFQWKQIWVFQHTRRLVRTRSKHKLTVSKKFLVTFITVDKTSR